MNDLDEKPPLMSEGLRHFLWRRIFELGGVFVLFCGVCLAIILLSADPSDPSFNTASSQQAQNLFGPVGADIAAAFFSAFGWSAFLFSLCFLIWGIRIIVQKKLASWKIMLQVMLFSILL